MSNLAELINLGKELGYEGEQLRQFVKNEQDNERQKRLEDREHETQRRLEDREHETQRRLEDRERETQQQEYERQSQAQQLRIIEAETARLAAAAQLQLQQPNSPVGSEGSRSLEGGIKVKGPSLPDFDETKDDLDAYLRRFEVFATAAQWSRENWAVALCSHLKGTALEVFSRLPHEDALDYEKVKLALMERFECTEEGFRTKFRSVKPQRGERVKQFVDRLRNLFTRWVELSKCDHTVEGLTDLMISEQLLQSCSSTLAMYLKERLPLKLSQLVELAEGYVTAHGGFHSNVRRNVFRSEKGNADVTVKEKLNDELPVKKEARPNFGACFVCGKPGHKAANCFSRNMGKTMKKQQQVSTVQHGKVLNRAPVEGEQLNACVHAEVLDCGHIIEIASVAADMPIAKGWIENSIKVDVLRDTGCSTVIVREDLVPKERFLRKKSLVRLADGQVQCYPVASFNVETPYYVGQVKAVCMPTPLYDMIIGNIPGATPLEKPGYSITGAVVTRSTEKEKLNVKPKLKTIDVVEGLSMNVEEIVKAQQEDESLQKLFACAQEGRSLNKKGTAFAVIKNKLLYKVYKVKEEDVYQLVLPKSVRGTVLKLAHEGVFGGHLGIAKTLGKIQQHFTWPGMVAEITRFCQSCNICQRTMPKGKIGKVPLMEMPLIDTPFQRVAVDLIGPIEPRSNAGKRYILTLVDYTTRYPEAIALSNIDTVCVAEAMIEIFSRVGIPKEIVTDRGSQFTSGMMQEVHRLLSLKHLPTTPYHAMGNGLVERFNGT